MFPGAKAAKTCSATTRSSRIGRSRWRSLPGHDGWTYGAAQSVFAASPDRVFVLQRGELPVLERPATQRLRDVAPSLEYPVFRLPIRSATVASPPAGGAAGAMPPDGLKAWQDAGGVLGVDARWEHCILVFDRNGNIVEDWTQWDSMLARPHAVYVSPYDPDEHVWIVDDFRHAIFKFTNDGKRLVQTIGTVQRARRRRDALLPPDVHGVAARRHVLRRRRLREHARREVRRERQVPHGLGRERHAAERDAARLLEQRARHRRRSAHAARVRQRPRE